MGPVFVRAAVTEDHTLGGVNNGSVFTYGSGGYKFKLKLLFVFLKGKLPLSAMWQIRYTETVPLQNKILI